MNHLLIGLLKWDGDRDAAHDLIQLKIAFRAERMAVMAGDAGGRHGMVRIDGLEILFFTAGHRTGDRSIGLTP